MNDEAGELQSQDDPQTEFSSAQLMHRLSPDPSRGSLPWAIVGTGPSASDVTDWGSLLEHRRVVAINGALDWIPNPDVFLLHDATAATKWISSLKPPTMLVVTKLVTQTWGVGIPHDAHALIMGYQPRAFVKLVKGGSGSQAVKYLAESLEVKHLELYGIDLNTNAHRNQIEPLLEILKEYKMKICLPCRSTQLPREIRLSPGKWKPELALESRPWVK